MPDYFSHIIAAEKIYEALKPQQRRAVCDHTLYLLGAQGGDVFFPYHLSLNSDNLGKKLHHLSAQEVFGALVHGNLSYCAGFATHYALDCTLHPAVYAFEDAHKGTLSHLRFENDLGLYISRKYGVTRKILPRDRVVAATFPVYDSIKLLEDDVTVTGVERCLKRHFTFTKFCYRNKKQTYRYDYDYASLSGAVEDAVELGVAAVSCILDGKTDGDVFSKQFLQH